MSDNNIKKNLEENVQTRQNINNLKDDEKYDAKYDAKDDEKYDAKDDETYDAKDDVKDDVKDEEKGNNITILNSITENYLSWSLIFIAVYCISPHFLKGILTFFFVYFIAYFSHVGAHKKNNIFTILHRYHHNHNNFFSHFIQYVIELGFPFVFLPLYYYFGTIFLDEWIVMFSAIFYSTVHNINYGYFRVNNVHSLHHKSPFTNVGPDLCDVIFKTKNKVNKNVENTNHHIPNIIIVTSLILLLKRLYSNVSYTDILKKILIGFLLSCLTITIVSSCYLYYKENRPLSELFKIENYI